MATEIATDLSNFMADLREAEKKAQPTRVTFTTTMQCEDGEPDRPYIQNLKLRIDRSIILHLAEGLKSYDKQKLLEANVEDPYQMMFTEERIGHHYATKTKTLRIFWNMWILKELLPHFQDIVKDASWMSFEHEDSQFPTTVQYASHRRTQQALICGVPTLFPALTKKYINCFMAELAKKGIISEEAELLEISARGHTRNEGESPAFLHATELLVTYVDSQPGGYGTIPLPGHEEPLLWRTIRPRRTSVPLASVPALTNYPVREVQYAAMVGKNEIQTDNLTNLKEKELTIQDTQAQHKTATTMNQKTTQTDTNTQETVEPKPASNNNQTEIQLEEINQLKKQKPVTNADKQDLPTSEVKTTDAADQARVPNCNMGEVHMGEEPSKQEHQDEAQNNRIHTTEKNPQVTNSPQQCKFDSPTNNKRSATFTADHDVPHPKQSPQRRSQAKRVTSREAEKLEQSS